MNSSLQSILRAREERWVFRQELVKKHRKPLLSLSMVIPGPDKNLPGVLEGFTLLASRVDELVEGRIETVSQLFGADGPSWHWVMDMRARDLKALAVDMEESHPLGRLADLDVLDETGEPLGRIEMGYPSRKCLLCDRPAKVCGASRSHSLYELVSEIRFILGGPQDI